MVSALQVGMGEPVSVQVKVQRNGICPQSCLPPSRALGSVDVHGLFSLLQHLLKVS